MTDRDAGGTSAARAPVAFYCVSDERYFLGAVAMVNSLRLLGHSEPIRLLDCGLTVRQRELLEPQVEPIAAPDDTPPWLLKTVAPLARPADVAVLVDSDMIVTRSLGPLIARAAGGLVVAFRDRQDRWFSEWSELGLGEPRRRPYVSSGFVALGGDVGPQVLALIDSVQREVDFERTFWRRNVRDYPFLYADQDVLNAVLATRVDPEHAVALDARLAATPPYRRLRLLDPSTLRCEYADGTSPYVIHQYVRKPWLEPTYHGIYSRLLARLLLGPGIAIRVPERDVPSRLRPGMRARLERAKVSAADFLRWHLGPSMPAPVGRRLEDRRRRREAPGR